MQVKAGTFSDLAGNDNAADTTLTIPVETTVPSVAFTTTADSLNAGETATITVTLSEESPDFSQDSLLVSGGVLSQLQASSATSYTGTFTPTAESTAEGQSPLPPGKSQTWPETPIPRMP